LPSPTVSPPAPSLPPSGASGLETVTTFDGQGLPTTVVVPAGWAAGPKSYDQQGFLIIPGATTSPATTATAVSQAQKAGEAGGDNSKENGATRSIKERVWWLSLLALASILAYQL
jgi:hypothetical protein